MKRENMKSPNDKIVWYTDFPTPQRKYHSVQLSNVLKQNCRTRRKTDCHFSCWTTRPYHIESSNAESASSTAASIVFPLRGNVSRWRKITRCPVLVCRRVAEPAWNRRKRKFLHKTAAHAFGEHVESDARFNYRSRRLCIPGRLRLWNNSRDRKLLLRRYGRLLFHFCFLFLLFGAFGFMDRLWSSFWSVQYSDNSSI